MDYEVEDFVAYVVSALGPSPAYKVSLVAFLAQYDVGRWLRRAVEYRYGGRPLARAVFRISADVIYSDEILATLESDLFTSEWAGLNTVVVSYVGAVPRLPNPVATRVDKTVRRYGNVPAWRLLHAIFKLFRLETREKRLDYLGVPVPDYLVAERFRLRVKELA